MVIDHAEGTLPAAFHALATEQALIGVVGKHKTFFFLIQDGHVDGVGRTIHYAQTTARTSLSIPLKETAQAGRVDLPLERVILGRRAAEQGGGYI